jgi:hypothetical protein
MIEKQNINGRQASVAYFSGNFIPADKDRAEFAKIVFEDNLESMILRLKDPDNRSQRLTPRIKMRMTRPARK